MIERTLEQPILKALTESRKVIILFGARQVGKTTLSNKLLSEIKSGIQNSYLPGISRR